jgi:hypothetical protein
MSRLCQFYTREMVGHHFNVMMTNRYIIFNVKKKKHGGIFMVIIITNYEFHEVFFGNL